MQLPPPLPQASSAVPSSQVVPLQQPLGQVVLSQTGAHLPATQLWPVGQAVQA
jgi:hypothetical protein